MLHYKKGKNDAFGCIPLRQFNCKRRRVNGKNVVVVSTGNKTYTYSILEKVRNVCGYDYMYKMSVNGNEYFLYFKEFFYNLLQPERYDVFVIDECDYEDFKLHKRTRELNYSRILGSIALNIPDEEYMPSIIVRLVQSVDYSEDKESTVKCFLCESNIPSHNSYSFGGIIFCDKCCNKKSFFYALEPENLQANNNSYLFNIECTNKYTSRIEKDTKNNSFYFVYREHRDFCKIRISNGAVKKFKEIVESRNKLHLEDIN